MTMRNCPVCSATSDSAKIFLERNIDQAKLSEYSFASRKVPEFMCHQLVQCPACDLVYANDPPDDSELAESYHAAEFDSQEEANDAAKAYIVAIEATLRMLKRRQSALEIGAGTGIFLELLAGAGFTELIGVEPSTAAIRAAPAARRAWIREGMFDERQFAPGQFDLICCFMTMEHVRDPKVIAEAAWRLLRPGGAFVTVTHDYRGMVNRFLGRRSPIIDIEHLQLFSKPSLSRLFAETGYCDVSVKAFINTYRMQYWLRLAPLPDVLKTAANGFAHLSGLERVRLGVNVGNLITAGFKPNKGANEGT
jgi:SAM-dependent methyltransferase